MQNNTPGVVSYKHCLFVLTLILGLCSIVLPNSFPMLNAVFLVAIGTFAIARISHLKIPRLYFFFITGSVITTLLYIVVGINNGASQVAVSQVLIIYIVSPIMWFFVCLLLVNQYGAKSVCHGLAKLSLLCTVSVALYVYLFFTHGPSAVGLFIENPNVFVGDGRIEARMYVHGSLIFLSAAVISAPEIITNKLLRVVIVGALILTAVSSGRTALMVALPIGFLVNISFLVRQKPRLDHVLSFVAIITLLFLLLPYFLDYFQLSSKNIFGSVTQKFELDPYSGRGQQMRSLIKSIEDESALGRGHGVGVDVVRNIDYPWRYEMVWLATLHRVGLIGSLIYAAPFLAYILGTLKIFFKRRLRVEEKFLFGGFLAAFFASNTNPYIEGFVFQWMYVLPVVAWVLNSTETQPRQ